MKNEQKLGRKYELPRLEEKVAIFSDGSGRLSRKAQAMLSFELKEVFRLTDILQVVGIPNQLIIIILRKWKRRIQIRS